MSGTHRNTLTLIRYFIGAYPKQSTMAVLALLLAGIAETLGIGALLPLITIIIEGDVTPNNAMAAVVLKGFDFINLTPTLLTLLAIIVVSISLKAIIVFQAMRYVSYVSTDIARDFRLKLISALMSAKWTYFSGLSIGKISNSISSEATRAGHCYLLFGRTIASLVQTVIYIVAAFLVSWQVSLIAIVMGIVVAVFVKGFITMSRRAGNDLTVYMNQMISQLNESLSGIKPLRAMGQEENYIKQLNQYTTDVMRAQKKQALSNLLLQIVYEPIAVLLLAVGLFYILSYTQTPVASVLLLAFLFYRLLTQANLLQSFYQNMIQNESAVWSMLDEINAAKTQDEKLSDGATPTLNKEITLDGISIKYDDTEIFSNFSATIPKNKISVLFGPSGTGKTSLIDAILGFIPYANGDIKIDKMSLSDIDLKAWRKKTGYVPQETFLFHDTIKQNITLGNADYSDDDIHHAMEQSGAQGFITDMPDGMNSIVGERGGKLSGGQRQRIAMARALIRKPDLLVLDESTSGLDAETEDKILETLKSLSNDITIILISHNPKILDIADHVIQIEKKG